MRRHPIDEYVRVAEFRSAMRRFLRRSEHAARRFGLTPQRYLLLLMIQGAPSGEARSTVTELSDRLQLAQSTVTELVGRAETAGLVQRQQSTEDARVAYLRLTDEGSRRLDGVFSELEADRQQLLEAILSLAQRI
jgi:DNA-binding MarR family transcriptional regulator